MDRKFAYFIFLGAAIGVMFGVMWTTSRNIGLGIMYGALAGAAIGWFIAAARTQSQNQKDKSGKR